MQSQTSQTSTTSQTITDCGGACSRRWCACARQPVRYRSASPSPEPQVAASMRRYRSASPSPEPQDDMDRVSDRSASPPPEAEAEEEASAEMDESGDGEYPDISKMTDNGSAAIIRPTPDFVEKFRLVQRYYAGTFNLLPTNITFHDSLKDPFTPTVIEAYYRPRFVRHARQVSDDELAIAHVRLHFKIGIVVYELISSGFGYSVYLVRVNGDIKLVNIVD